MEILELLKAVLFGIVEGITEWLPISSTGHMILFNQFVKLNVSEDFWKLFEVVIQFGAILAVVLLFWNKLWPFTTKTVKFIIIADLGTFLPDIYSNYQFNLLLPPAQLLHS